MDEYNTLNGLMAESLPKIGDGQEVKMDTEEKNITDDKGEEDTPEMKVDSDDEVDELKRIINSTLEYVLKIDKKELGELLVKIKEEAGEEFLDAVLELEGLIDVLLQDELLENEPVLPKLDEIRKKLENSNIPK